MQCTKRAIPTRVQVAAANTSVRPVAWSNRVVGRGECLQRRTLPTAAASKEDKDKLSAAEATEKYGLEAGLFKTIFGGFQAATPGLVFSSKPDEEGGDKLSKTDQAKQLLAQYGSAYLVTSITFAIISFSLCYFAVNAGLDIGALLSKIGLSVTDTNEKVGTFAIAYAAHKALSPVRFPPTVALTPVVAKWIGKKVADKSAEKEKE